jgi:flagellar protein FlaJ
MSFGDPEQASGGPGGLEQAGELLSKLFLPIYDRAFDDESDFVRSFGLKLKQARMSDTEEMYLSRAIGVGVLTAILFVVLGGLFSFVLFVVLDIATLIAAASSTPWTAPGEQLLSENAQLLITAAVTIVIGIAGFWVGFLALVAIPYMRSSAREREITLLVPDVVSFMYALSEGGLNQLEIIRAVAQAEDVYGEAALEFRTIVHESQYFDTDYRNAIHQQSVETPSNELSQFFTDMLSIINSGGDMTSFLRNKKNRYLRTAQKEREEILETLELFGEMYMTLALAPLLLIILFVIMGIMGNSTDFLILMTVYGIIPLVGVAFLVLISTVKLDEPGDGYIAYESEGSATGTHSAGGLLDTGLIDRYIGDFSVFSDIKSKEALHQLLHHLLHPYNFFRDNPLYSLAFSVPMAVVAIAAAVTVGDAPTSWQGAVANPVWGTFTYFYLPMYVTMVPLGFFYEWNLSSRRGITNSLSEDLRQLASANSTGLTLLQSLRTVSETSSGRLADEFEIVAKKVEYGNSLEEAMIEFNNKYHIPRLARTVKLITKAEEASNYITDVLSTAAQASENADDIERERKSRTRMQVAIIIMTYVVLLAVMALLKTQFINTLAVVAERTATAESGGPAGGGGVGFQNINASRLSMLFFHAVTLQAIMSGIIAGYMRDAEIMAGVKFVVILETIALVVWTIVENIPVTAAGNVG